VNYQNQKMPSLASIQASAVQAAKEAGKVLLKYFGGELNISEKEGAGLVTNADMEAQMTAVSILRKAFPDFGFLTEEAAPEAAQSPGRWIIDPLDGTTNFVHRFPMFCVSIAAEWNHELTVGVIYHPVLDEIYIGTKGHGATVNGTPLKVSQTDKIENSLLTTGFTYRKDQFLKAEMQAFERLSGKARAIRRPGSAALDLAYTARGVFDGFWERRLSPWDIAAGALIVMEAGGKVTDFEGNPFKLDGGELLASNSKLHNELLTECRIGASK
jgi:myo-inositol-1(or 4)-monophosphatase